MFSVVGEVCDLTLVTERAKLYGYLKALPAFRAQNELQFDVASKDA